MPMLRTFRLFAALLLLPMLAQGQTACEYEVKGRVYDQVTKAPLPFVSVKVVRTTLGAVTDEQGRFHIKHICDEEFDLQFSFVGYQIATHHHDVYHTPPKIFLAPDNVYLESVVVEDEKLTGDLASATVSQINAEALERIKGSSMGDVVATLPGVSTLSTGQNVVKPVIHGLHSNRVLIINNGVRHEFQNWGASHAPEIDASLADHMEVVKGAATVRYGPDALGGVILVHPAKLDFLSHWDGTLGITGESNGRAGEVSGAVQKGFHHVAFRAEGALQRQGDLHTPNYILSNTGMQEASGAASVRFHKGAWNAEGYYSRVEQELGILRGSVTGNLLDLVNSIESDVPPETKPFTYFINTPRQETAHDLVVARASHTTAQQVFNLQYAWQHNIRKEFDVRRGTLNERPSIDLVMDTHIVDADWKHPVLGGLQGTLGLQGLYQNNLNMPGTGTTPFIPNFNTYRAGVYAIESWQRNTGLYELGLRYDFQYNTIAGRDRSTSLFRNTLSFHNITATLGFQRKLGPHSSLMVNAGTAWRPPNMAELYAFGKHGASISYGLWRYSIDELGTISTNTVLDQNDREVKAEAGLKGIATYALKYTKLQAEFTGYANLIQDYIYSTPAGITNTTRGAFPYFIYDQTDALLVGADFSLRWQQYKALASSFSGAYVYARDMVRQQYFVGTPPASGRYEAELDLQQLPTPWVGKLGLAKSELYLELAYTARQWQAPRVIAIADILKAKEEGRNIFAEDDSFFDIVPQPEAYWLTHVSWSGGIGQLTLNAQVRNLFNINYRNYTNRLRYFADEQGRNVVVTLQYRFH